MTSLVLCIFCDKILTWLDCFPKTIVENAHHSSKLYMLRRTLLLLYLSCNCTHAWKRCVLGWGQGGSKHCFSLWSVKAPWVDSGSLRRKCFFRRGRCLLPRRWLTFKQVHWCLAGGARAFLWMIRPQWPDAHKWRTGLLLADFDGCGIQKRVNFKGVAPGPCGAGAIWQADFQLRINWHVDKGCSFRWVTQRWDHYKQPFLFTSFLARKRFDKKWFWHESKLWFCSGGGAGPGVVSHPWASLCLQKMCICSGQDVLGGVPVPPGSCRSLPCLPAADAWVR